METSIPDHVLEILKKTSEGNGTFPELAEALKSLENASLVVPTQEFLRFNQDLNKALEEKGYGNVTVKDAETPKFVGLTTDDGGFVPRVFTDHMIAREYAVTSGLVQPDENVFMTQRGWVGALFEFLNSGYQGVIIDSGSDHEINLERKPLARLCALMTLEEFAKLEQLELVLWQGKPFFQVDDKGTRTVFVFDQPAAADWWKQHGPGNREGVGTSSMPTLDVLRIALEGGMDVLYLNPALGDERFYTRDEVEQMVRILGADPTTMSSAGIGDPSLTPGGGAAAASTGSVELPRPMQLARKYATLPMWPTPEITDEESRQRLRNWQPIIEEQSAEPWQLIESIAHEWKVYVPVHFRNVEGCHWPQFFRHPARENQTVMYFYSTESRVKEALSTSDPESQNYTVMSGIEAMRWAWAAPTRIDEFGFDWPDKEASTMFPSWWSLNALYPLSIPLGNMEKVPDVGFARLGGLPGVRGTRPEAIKTLVNEWKRLFELRVDGADAACTTEIDGATWLPVFTSREQAFEFNVKNGGLPGTPSLVSGEAPFDRWLRNTAGCAGVVLDPAGPWPLKLDRTALLVLKLWANSPGSQPAAHHLIQDAARLLHDKTLTMSEAAHVAASLPKYWFGVQKLEGGGVKVLQMPGQDTGVLFSNKYSADLCLQWYRQMGLVTDEMEPVCVHAKWMDNPFLGIQEGFTEGVHIDPDAFGGAGLHLDAEGLEMAIRYTDERLKPRVPNFCMEP